MIEIKREEFKEDEMFSKIYEDLKKSHKVPEYTIRILMENRHIDDFCQESRHFVSLTGKDPIFLHYDVSCWIAIDIIPIRIEAITFYDNFMEFEAAKNRGLHGSKNSDIPNIN